VKGTKQGREGKARQKREGPGFDSRPLQLYKSALKALQQKQHAAAIEEFDLFLEQYPDHDYADNSLYWMGEAYYDLKDYGKALDCFEKLVTFYPDGNKVPDASLKAALSHRHLGDDVAPREVARQLQGRFPSTTAAAIAKERLQ